MKALNNLIFTLMFAEDLNKNTAKVIRYPNVYPINYGVKIF
jgi:hypothetical protein